MSGFDNWMIEGIKKGYAQETDKQLRIQEGIDDIPTKEDWDAMLSWLQKEVQK